MSSVWRRAAAGAILVFLVMTVSGVPSSSHKQSGIQYAASQELQEHGMILINQNTEFAEWPGNGTAENPYVIENLTIGGQDECVTVYGTSVHFVIRNCLFQAIATCVRFEGVGNGTVERCMFTGGINGITVSDSALCRLKNNDISGVSNGLVLSNVNNISAAGNSIHHCNQGVVLLDAVFSLFNANDIFANLENGLNVLGESANNTFLTNSFGWNARVPGLHYDAEDDGLQNRWDNGTHGNFWTDTVAGSPRTVPGRANSTDSVPALLTDSTAPVVTDPPEDAVVDEGKRANLEWNASDRFPDMYDMYIDGSEHSSLNWLGHGLGLTNEFPIGAHNVTVVFRDCSDNRVVDTVIVQVIWGFFGGIGTEIVFASSVLSVLGVLLAVAIIKRR